MTLFNLVSSLFLVRIQHKMSWFIHHFILKANDVNAAFECYEILNKAYTNVACWVYACIFLLHDNSSQSNYNKYYD